MHLRGFLFPRGETSDHYGPTCVIKHLSLLAFTKTHLACCSSSFVQPFKLKVLSVRRVLCKYTERVWKPSSVGPNHFKQLGGDSCSWGKEIITFT